MPPDDNSLVNLSNGATPPNAAPAAEASPWYSNAWDYLMGGAKQSTPMPTNVDPALAKQYQDALNNGDYALANSIAPQVGQGTTTPGTFENLTSMMTGRPNDQLNRLEQGTQFALPYLLKILQDHQYNQYLQNNGSMVNNQAAANLSSARASMPSSPGATAGFKK